MERLPQTFTIAAYTIVDADRSERFSLRDFGTRDDAERERNRLALHYGKEFCLEVWAIDTQGNLRVL